MGYCVHAFNAIHVGGKWIKLDAREINQERSLTNS